MLNEALPLTRFTVASAVAPSRNVTVPVGTPVAGATGFTVALNVTACPKMEGLGVEVRLVVVLPGFTAWVAAGEVLALKVGLPLQAAVSECLLGATVGVTREGWPWRSAAVPSTVAPSQKAAAPGEPRVPGPTGRTTAVNVTAWPITEGFGGAVRLVVVCELTPWVTA